MPTFNEYQKFTNTTAKYPGQGGINGLIYATLGLTGEAGEIANKVKKVLRDTNGTLTEETRLKIIDETGDCMYYLARMAVELNTSMEQLAEINTAKLKGRLERGTIQGSGDNR